jgi:hypothetical protein
LVRAHHVAPDGFDCSEHGHHPQAK